MARVIVDRVLARDKAAAAPAGATGLDPSLVAACSRVLANLQNTMGHDGCAALLERAIAQTLSAHPALKHVVRIGSQGIELGGAVESPDAREITAIQVAIEAVLASLVEILVRLIGEDMTIRLIGDERPSAPADENRAS